MEVLPPEAVADEHAGGRVALKALVGAGEIVSDRGRNSEHLQKARSDECALDLDGQGRRRIAGVFGVISSRGIRGVFGVVSADRLERGVQMIPVFQPYGRNETFSAFLLR